MNLVESILQSDDRNLGSFGTFEKSIGYTTLLCITVPILIIPFFFILVGKSVYRLTALFFGIVIFLFLIIRLRFSWIVKLDHQLRRFYHA